MVVVVVLMLMYARGIGEFDEAPMGSPDKEGVRVWLEFRFLRCSVNPTWRVRVLRYDNSKCSFVTRLSTVGD